MRRGRLAQLAGSHQRHRHITGLPRRSAPRNDVLFDCKPEQLSRISPAPSEPIFEEPRSFTAIRTPRDHDGTRFDPGFRRNATPPKASPCIVIASAAWQSRSRKPGSTSSGWRCCARNDVCECRSRCVGMPEAWHGAGKSVRAFSSAPTGTPSGTTRNSPARNNASNCSIWVATCPIQRETSQPSTAFSPHPHVTARISRNTACTSAAESGAGGIWGWVICIRY